MERLKVGQKVLCDGLEGFIEHVYPYGHGQYLGVIHAYYWVRIPGTDFTDLNYSINGQKLVTEHCFNGRAVPFADADERLKLLE